MIHNEYIILINIIYEYKNVYEKYRLIKFKEFFENVFFLTCIIGNRKRMKISWPIDF